MEIYLDANATTSVLPLAREAALTAMAEDFGNPSSMHTTGLKARARLDAVRSLARRVLGAPSGKLLFLSGATEGIQTAVLSALASLRNHQDLGVRPPELLLYGATEHKAVPEALRHWSKLLGLNLQILAIPVDRDGRHDLQWLRAHVPRAGLVCTMAANNETGVISDLDGIAEVMAGSPALWMVDSVQALGKMKLKLAERRIDYAPFSGHKLYAPKGIGLLYVREGAPFTALMAGGGQEDSQRSGTENMSGIAALGAVLAALESGRIFKHHDILAAYRDRLASELQNAFEGLVFNASPALSLPTTLNFSVPGLSSKLLQDLFDAADVRVSGGSACSAAKAQPSYVLEAMGLPSWQTASAIRLSFGPAVDADFIEEACTRIRACGESLRQHGLSSGPQNHALPADGLTRLQVDGACCYLLADADSRRCVVFDPLPALHQRLVQWLACQGYTLAAVLSTWQQGDQGSAVAKLLAAVPPSRQVACDTDAMGWPGGASQISLGKAHLTRLELPGQTDQACTYVLHDKKGGCLVFVGDALAPESTLSTETLRGKLEQLVEPQTLLLPAHDTDDRFAYPLDPAACSVKHRGIDSPPVELLPSALQALLDAHPDLQLVDVREPYEQGLGQISDIAPARFHQAVPLSGLLNALPDWLDLPADTPVLFVCRSGNRSAQAAKALRRLGHGQAWSLAGGLALWPRTTAIEEAVANYSI